MRNFAWICCFLWESLPTLTAHPSNPTVFSETDSHPQWQLYWLKYTIGLLGITVTAFTLVGCLCCRRNRRPKGFQDKGKNEQEFKNGNEAGICHSFHGLELEVPHNVPADRVQFEPLPVERFVGESNNISKPKPLPPSPSLFENESDLERVTVHNDNHDWLNASDIHVPRERLKYVREVGHGWFGKVVEGCIDVTNLKRNIRNGNVVVRILTEEATAKEKAWFLGEATPYFKLRHRNILSLLGSCLETDPYLLLFESCPPGDLKGFLRSNNDPNSRETLTKQNMPTRIAIEVAAGLRHMHEHGFAHTDLSARNCLVASDLSVKLGDYGTSVEKYPADYYVVGDRALPIRWSAPESLLCTETTIETREITPKANIWSYAILLWEISTWGERPYDDLGDEQIIQMLLSVTPKAESVSLQLLMCELEKYEVPTGMVQAMQSCLTLDLERRPDLAQLRHTLLKDKLDAEDFEQRWESLRPMRLVKERTRSASLQDLRGSVDSECWNNLMEDKSIQTPQASFRLGPEEPIKNLPGAKFSLSPFRESDSETEEESWRMKVERGAYTEKVKQKSKSVADLMVLVYIDPDSDADVSLGPQISDKSIKKRLPTTGSDGDLRSAVLADEFDQALKKLREPQLVNNFSSTPKSVNNFSLEKLSAFPLLTNQNQTSFTLTSSNDEAHMSNNNEAHRYEIHDKENQLLLFTNDLTQNASCFSTNFDVQNDISLWNSALDSVLEQKIPGFLDESEFHKIPESVKKQGDETGYNSSDTVQLTPQSLENEVELLNAESHRKHDAIDVDEYRKRVSTPDDERSSDSGFRDKESCEDEESPLPRLPVPLMKLPTDELPSHSAQESAEEEQLRILLELDTILDAEYNSTLTNSLECNVRETESYVHNVPGTDKEKQIVNTGNEIKDVEMIDNVNETLQLDVKVSSAGKLCSKNEANILDDCERPVSHCDLREVQPAANNAHFDGASLDDNENEDDESSTMSLRSDNSYVSFSMDEEFVTAIRNELREKLPQAQLLVVEPLEPRDEDEHSVAGDGDIKTWDDEDIEDSSFEQGSGIDISIRYNLYGAPLSPILEERESALNSESVISKEDSRDVSIASKESASEEDVLMVDTRTNQALLLEGTVERLKEEENRRGKLNNDSNTFDDDNNEFEVSSIISTYSSEKRSGIQIGGSGGGAPLPSPEEEFKWQKMSCSFPLPLQMQEDCMMSTSFATERDWDNQDEEVEEGEDEEDEEEEEEGEDEEEEEEDNSSSSGEFVWKRYDKSRTDLTHTNSQGMIKVEEEENEKDHKRSMEERIEQEVDEEGEIVEEEEEEFTPSAWDATLAPHRSALRSPDKSLKSGDQKKSVWFKKQNYHCVYEYPKEVPTVNTQEQPTTTWERTTYADWEEMIDETRLDQYPIDYDDTTKDDEFYVTSSNRPFQFQTGNDKYVSQFFPGANAKILQRQEKEEQAAQEKDPQEDPQSSNQAVLNTNGQQQQQLGELRHTRDRLKLNLVSSNGANVAPQLLIKQNNNEDIVQSSSEKIKTTDSTDHSTDYCSMIDEDTSSTGNETRATHEPRQIREDNVHCKNLTSSPLKLSPSEKRKNLDCNENCGFLEHG